MAYNIIFSPDAWADYLYWQTQDKKTLKRMNKLLQELQRDGVVPGYGEVELLCYVDGMSKRIDDKNQLTYTMEDNNLVILSCRGHLTCGYGKWSKMEEKRCGTTAGSFACFGPLLELDGEE